MTKADIVREIATQTGLEKQVVLQVVEGFMDSVKSSMINGEEGGLSSRLRFFYHQTPCGKDSTQHKQEYHDNSACPQYPGIQTVKSLCRKDEIRQIR